jgi:pimeloyl-ACP methyl ester carboxylesterase
MVQRKLLRLQHRLERSLFDRYPSGVEIICPDGVLSLMKGTSPDLDNPYEFPDGTTGEQRGDQDITGLNLRGWWKNLDTVNRYDGLLESLEMLAAMLREKPCDGIIGFSQGATLATMLAALCEGSPARLLALASQGEPIHVAPPQAPFKFALLSCGYKATKKYYNGFYSPQLTTPILFDTATLDHMVEPSLSDAWITVSHNSQTISRIGGHWFPTDDKSLHAMVAFASKAHLDIDPAPFVIASVKSRSLWEDFGTEEWSVPSSELNVSNPIVHGRSKCRCRLSSRTFCQWRSRRILRRIVVVRGTREACQC